MKPLLLTAVLALCTGCMPAAHYRPIVDSGESRGYYEGDLADCQQLAERRPAAARAAAGATAGALIGAALGLAVGLRGDDVGHLAAWGAVTGGVGEGVDGAAQQRYIVARCLEGRGYNVIAE
jgi:hypothetical protein